MKARICNRATDRLSIALKSGISRIDLYETHQFEKDCSCIALLRMQNAHGYYQIYIGSTTQKVPHKKKVRLGSTESKKHLLGTLKIHIIYVKPYNSATRKVDSALFEGGSAESAKGIRKRVNKRMVGSLRENDAQI